MIKLNVFAIVLGNHTDELENVLAILEGKVALVAQRVGIVGHVRILVDLDGGTAQLHVGGDGDANIIGLALLDVQGYAIDSALGLPLRGGTFVGGDGINTVGKGEARVSDL